MPQTQAWGQRSKSLHGGRTDHGVGDTHADTTWRGRLGLGAAGERSHRRAAHTVRAARLLLGQSSRALATPPFPPPRTP
ncbi:MAG: hypothetical protein VX294_13790 [Candidatus Latescibacterota bacterium]|nr:hypothetical protein [Candidatus Latescibacterota bacterium]